MKSFTFVFGAAAALVGGAQAGVAAGEVQVVTRSREQRLLAIESNAPFGDATGDDHWVATVEDFTSSDDRCSELALQLKGACVNPMMRGVGDPDDFVGMDFDDTCTVAFKCPVDVVLSGALDEFAYPEQIERNRAISLDDETADEDAEADADESDAADSDAAAAPADVTLLVGSGPRLLKRGGNKLSWGLKRIDSPSLPLSRGYTPEYTGKGVNIYMVDTGVLSTHSQFKGRYTFGFTTVKGEDNEDHNGHGTHTAGTAAGSSFGVAPDANLIGVKVLGERGSGSTADVVRGIQWAYKEQKRQHKGQAAVISISIGGWQSKAMDNAVKKAAKAGMIVVVAAGNNNRDACLFSPARTGGRAARRGGVVTVMSSDNKDRRSSFSNFGKCTDVIAPGTNIVSAWKNGGSKTLSGTSMATPHVSGVAAQLLQKHNFDKDKAQRELLKLSIVPNMISDEKSGSKDLLLQKAH